MARVSGRLGFSGHWGWGFPHADLVSWLHKTYFRSVKRVVLTTILTALTILVTGTNPAAASSSPVVVSTTLVGSGPLGVAVSPDGTTAYITNSIANTISVLDIASGTVGATISGASSPQGIAFTPDGSHAYATVTNGFAQIDTTTQSIVQTISGGFCTTPVRIVANPAGGAMYAACSTNNRGVTINTGTQVVTDEASTTEALNDVAIAPDGGSLIWARDTRVWFPSSGSFVTTTSAPTSIAVVQGINKVFSVNSGSGTLNVIDSVSKTLTNTMVLGGSPVGIALSSDGALAYVTDSTNNELLVIDVNALTILHRIAVGASPQQVALTPDNRYAIVTNFASNSVSTVDLSPDGGSSPDSDPMPVFTLTFSNQDGSRCTRSSIQASFGTWVALPSASQCTPSGSGPGTTLLGWSTSPNFPVAIAQRQVDNGWGAYEIFNSEGAMTSVFIPAGGYAYISSPAQLTPIWSQ
jgi:YVTN family beta-propeller protein